MVGNIHELIYGQFTGIYVTPQAFFSFNVNYRE